MPIIDLVHKENEKLPEGAQRLNKAQIWVPRTDVEHYTCTCGSERACKEPGTDLYHCPDCGYMGTVKPIPKETPKKKKDDN